MEVCVIVHHVAYEGQAASSLLPRRAVMLLPHGIASVPLDVLNQGAPRRTCTVPSSAHARASACAREGVASHAAHGAMCHVPVLGAHVVAVARVLASQRDVEVRIMGGTQNAPPLLLSFPAPLLAHIGMVEDAATSDLHVLGVTVTGYLYRARLPFASLVHAQPLPMQWSSEHRIAALGDSPAAMGASVHVVDMALLLVACADGAVVRMHESLDAARTSGSAWRESVLRPSTFFLSRLFGRSHTEMAGSPAQTLALATHVHETDTPLAFCVCRDRKLRVWNIATDTLVRTLDLPGPTDAVWVDDATQPLVQLFYPDDQTYSFYVLVYVPTHTACLAAYGVELEESSSWSGGVGEMALVWSRQCDARTQAPDVEVRDMAVVQTGERAWRVWLLWHAGGAPLLQTTLVDGLRTNDTQQRMVLGSTDAPWTSVEPLAPYTPLHGPSLDAALASRAEALTPLFLARLCEPGRFSATTLAAALEAEGVHVMGEPLPRIVAAMSATVGASHTPDAWLRFARRVEQIDRAARWPLRLCMLGDVPCIMARHALGIVCERGAGAWLHGIAARLAAAAPHPDRPSARLAGEAASSEYAQVVNELAHEPRTGYAPVRDGGATLLQVATLAAEAYEALGPRGARLVDAHAMRGATLSNLSISTSIHDRLSALVDRIGGDGLVRECERLAALCAQDTWIAFAWLDAVTACAHMANVHARLHGTRALLTLLSLVTNVPQLSTVQETALGVWRTTRAMYMLASTVPPGKPVLGLVHLALERGVPHGASLDTFCQAVLLDAPDAVRACLLDTSPAHMYLRGRADACRGRTDEAYAALVQVQAALVANAPWQRLLPPDVTSATGPTQSFRFWVHAAGLLEACPSSAHACYRQALRALESGADVAEADARQVWTLVFRAQLALHLYDKACTTILSLPFDDLRMTCITTLVTTLCDAHETRTLVRLDLLDWQPHVERTLSFRARHASPVSHPSYFHILYAYHVSRGDYKSAAASMYQHARRLHVLAHSAPPDTMRTYAVHEAQSYLAAINALALLPPTHAWFAHDRTEGEAQPDAATTTASASGSALRGCVTQYVPTNGTPPLAIIQLADIRRDYERLLTRLELLPTYPELANASTPWDAQDALSLFIANDDFDQAWACAHRLHLRMDDVFDALTTRCVHLERTYHARLEQYKECDAALQALYMSDEETADPNAAFLRQSARTASWPGHAYERAWRYLHVCLDSTPGSDGAAYRRVIAERLAAQRAWDLAPKWLTEWFYEHAPDVLVRVFMQHGMLEQALAYCTRLVDASVSALRTSTTQPKAWLPYTLMDSLLAAADARGLHEPSESLRASLTARMSALHKRPHAVK